jgi:PAS domain S-box-containing protein
MPAASLSSLDFELLFAALPDPHLVLAPDGTVLALNTALRGLLSAERAMLVGQPIAALCAAAATAGVVLPPAAAWASSLHSPQAGLAQVLTPELADGSPTAATEAGHRYWQAILQPVATADTVRYLLVRLHDVSAQLHADAGQPAAPLLSENHHQLQWTANAEGLINYADQHWYDYTGLTPVETYGKGWLSALHPNDRAAALAHWQHCLATGANPSTAYRLRRAATGRYRWYLARAVAQRNAAGQVQQWFGTLTNIHDRKTAARRQQRQRRRDRHLLTHLDQLPLYLVTMHGPRHQIDYVSAVARNFLPAEAMGREAATLSPGPSAASLALFDEVLRSGETRHLGVVPAKALHGAKTGEAHHIDVTLIPLRGATGKVEGVLMTGLDLTDQLATEQQMAAAQAKTEQQQEQFRFLSEFIPQLLWTADPAGQPTYANQRWLDYMGLSDLESWNHGQSYVHPDDMARATALWQQSLQTGQSFEAEYRLRRHDGQYRWFLVQAQALRNATGSVQKWFGSCTEIEAQMRLQRQLEAKDARQRRILDQLPSYIATYEGPELRLTYLSPNHDELLAAPRAQVGQTLREAAPELAEQGLEALLRTVYDTGQPYRAYEQPLDFLVPATGQYRQRFLDFGYYPLFGPEGSNVQGILAFAQDVTAQVQSRREAEAQVTEARAADQRLRRVVESLPSITFITDETGQVRYMSPQWYEYCGTFPAEALAQQWRAQVHPDDLARVLPEHEAALQQGQPWSFELRLRRHDGQYRWFSSQGIPEPSEEAQAAGRPRQWFGSTREIHELWEARQTLEQKDRQLSQILNQVPALIATFAGPAHNVTFSNPGFDALAGYRVVPDRPLAELMPEAEDQGFVALMDEVYRTGEPCHGHDTPMALLDPPSGQMRHYYFDFIYQPLLDPQGVVNGIMVFVTDVTERVQARHQAEELAAHMQRRDERLRLMTESQPHISFITSGDGSTTEYLSPQWYAYTGTAPQASDTGTASTGSAMHPDDALAMLASFEQALAENSVWAGELRLRRHDGVYRWHLSRAVPQVDPATGRVLRWYGSTVDIQDLRELQDELARSREDFAALADNMAQLAWMADATGHIFWYNERWYEYTGSDLADMQGDGWMKVHDPALVEGVNQRYLEAIRLGQPWEDTFPLRGHDGRYRWFLSRALPIRDEATGAIVRWFGTNTDITEQRELTDELGRREEQLRFLAESVPQIVWTAQPDGHYDYINRRWFEYAGLPDPDTRLTMYRALHPDDLDEATRRWQHSLDTGEDFMVEYRFRRHDGEYHWFLGRARALRHPDGHVLKWFGTCTDIHDIYQLREKLTESEQELRIQAESIPQQIWTASPDGRLDFYNHRMTAYVGKALPADTADTWQELVHPEDYAHTQVRWIEALKNGRYYEAEYRLRRYDGQYRWFLAQAQARYDNNGQVLRWYGTNTDVHTQRELTDELGRREEQLRFLAESVPQIVWTAQPDGHYDYINRRWFEYAGLPDPDTRLTMYRALHPDDLDEATRRWQHSLDTGEDFMVEYRFRRHDGEYHWFLGRARALRHPDGHVLKWFGTCTDIEDQKQAQRLLQEQNSRLTLINQDLDNFVYTASHDLKQPINNMAGIFEELTRTAYFRDPDAIKLITYFERALAQIYTTIEDLSAIVQVQRQQGEVAPEDVELTPLTTEIINSVQDQVRQAQAQFDLDFTACPSVRFVRANLQSVLFNLISNSLKYAAPGRPPYIRLSAAPDATTGHPVITVQDNGLGIDLERYGNQLFQLFRRFHTHVGGSGMGLYLVNRIVQNSGGQLTVDSQVGVGTTFRIFLS